MLASLFSPLMCEVDGFEAVLILGLLLWDFGIVVSRGLRKELEEEFLLFSTFMIQPCGRGAAWDTGAAGHGAAVCTGAFQLAAEQLGCVLLLPSEHW